MEDKYKETLTYSVIEQDIKRFYLWNIKSLFLGIAFIILGIPFLLGVYDSRSDTKHNLIGAIMVIYFLILLFSLVRLSYCIYKCFVKLPKYSVVKDTFIKTGVKCEFGYGPFGVNCLCFKEQGKFPLHLNMLHYSWSKQINMNEKEMKNSAIPGDVYYLVIGNGRILNVYNTRFFVLKMD